MEAKQIKRIMYESVFGSSVLNNLQIVETKKGVFGEKYQLRDEKINYDKALIINSIDTYILSLCKFNLITLLENINNRFYTKNIEINSDNEENNYISVNSFADNILSEMVGDAK